MTFHCKACNLQVAFPQSGSWASENRSNVYKFVYVCNKSFFFPVQPLAAERASEQHMRYWLLGWQPKVARIQLWARISGCFERSQDVPVHPSGHLLIVKNSTASIIIAWVYMPCEDTALRKDIYEYLSGMAQKAETDKTTLVMAGDWNAAWTDLDRPNGVLSAVDKRHQKGLEQMRTCPAQVVQRSMTYRWGARDGRPEPD